MRLEIHIEEEDYILFNIYNVFHSRTGRQMIMKGRLLAPAISLLVIFVMVLCKADKWLLITEVIFLAVFSAAGFLTYPGWVKKRIRKQILDMKKEGALPYVADSSLTFEEDEIFEERPDGDRHIPYSSLAAVEENEDYIYLRKGAQEVLIIPEKCLTIPRKTFVDFISEKVKENSGI